MYQRLLKSLNHLNPRAWDFIQLTRMDKPIGIYLLLWPTLWALWIAGKGSPSFINIVIFVLGVVLTRAGGCAYRCGVKRMPAAASADGAARTRCTESTGCRRPAPTASTCRRGRSRGSTE